VDGLDDFGVVNPAQVGRGDAEVGVPELAVDDQQRDSFTGHLDGVWCRSWWGANRRLTPAASAVA
jgi:hypothetical protein